MEHLESKCSPIQYSSWKTVLVALILMLGMGYLVPVSAANMWVTAIPPHTSSGDGKCSLIEAIQNANKDSQVNVDCPAGSGTDTIHLQKYVTYVISKAIYDPGTNGSNGLPVIRSHIIIDGRGSTIIREGAAASPYRLFEVAPKGNLEIRDVELRNGGAVWFGVDEINDGYDEGSYSGGALHNAGRATLRRVFADSIAPAETIHNASNGRMLITQSRIAGGNNAINNDGQLTLRNSTIVHAPGTGVLNSSRGAKAILRNCTLAAESEVAIKNRGTILVDHCTISGNDLAIDNSGPEFVLSNSLVAGNYGQQPAYGPEIRDASGTISSNHNLFGDISKSFLLSDGFYYYFAENLTADQTDILATADGDNPTALHFIFASGGALDYALEHNGGPTETIALVPSSPAVDNADSLNCPARDQRLISRPQRAGCDIGAYELEPLSLGMLDYFSVEGYGPAHITVKLNYASARRVTVGYATQPRKALPGDDYYGVSGRLTFRPGETVKRIQVNMVDDTRREPAETFTVRLYKPENAKIARDKATVTILDDD